MEINLNLAKERINLNGQIVKTDLKLNYDNSKNPIYLKGSIFLKNKLGKKDLELTFGGDKNLLILLIFFPKIILILRKAIFFILLKLKVQLKNQKYRED